MSQTISARSLSIALALTALSALAVLAVLAVLGPNWAVYAPATCTATHCFCELPRVGALVLQPADSWSSYGYVLVGFVMIILAGGRDWASAMPPLAARALGLTAIVVGLGSVLMHATLTLWGQFLDVLGMYLIGSFLLVRALARWRRIPDGRAIMLYVTLCACLIAVLIMLPEVRRWLFALLLNLAILVELIFARPLRPGVRVGLYLGGILATALAFAIWILDQQGVVCAPRSLLQGHALWHLLGALSLWLSFSYYRSERAA
ncbi:MAG: ceramidase domain-containing protein [Sphingomonas sp.]|jgi:dihydroceramidase|uniref:ceramidase domain-containing protein n=1 Tax=Sphingomonas sp. TaxID=28214 RepID=UPI0035669B9A